MHCSATAPANGKNWNNMIDDDQNEMDKIKSYLADGKLSVQIGVAFCSQQASEWFCGST
jgi:hypothetical protein